MKVSIWISIIEFMTNLKRSSYAFMVILFTLPMLAQTGGGNNATNAFVERMQGSMRDSAFGLGERAEGAPGYGYPGEIKPYEASEALQANLQRYGLTAGWYVRDAVATQFSERAALDYYAKKNKNRAFPDRVPFVLYAPTNHVPVAVGGAEASATMTPLPLLVFLPGRGELGQDLNRLFGQRGIIEKVTSAAFQEKHPCYLLIPSSPGPLPSCADGSAIRPYLCVRRFS